MNIQHPIRKLLIANRGEIAVRIHRAASESGIRTVAVFSDSDRCAPHVLFADEAYPLAGDLPEETYLNIDKLLEIARSAHCDAVHPGYGFLSENHKFAEAAASSGVIFVGPPASAIKSMGSKTGARDLMQRAGVPIVPGIHLVSKDYRRILQAVESIGYPLLIKAVHGGGGKGMRKVDDERSLESALDQAASESLKSFGTADVYIEKYLAAPRHIEIQILADTRGNVIFPGERECSIQRRHQKVIEECPSSRLSIETRNKMGQAAINAARACGYINAGTVEFMVDTDESFYFLEMNTRLQVEHAVTEAVYGIDLVREQLRIAQGEEISITQEAAVPRGHAIECRIYAEDPYNNFMPSIGTIDDYAPAEGNGIRNDSGIMRGSIVSRFYDPLLAKLIAWGPTREASRSKMVNALSEYKIAGVSTTIPFCKFVMTHPEFASAKYDIRFVDNHFKSDNITSDESSELVASFIAASMSIADDAGPRELEGSNTSASNWKLQRFESLP